MWNGSVDCKVFLFTLFIRYLLCIYFFLAFCFNSFSKQSVRGTLSFTSACCFLHCAQSFVAANIKSITCILFPIISQVNESINQVTIFGIKSSSLKRSRSSYINYQIILAKNIIIVGELPKLVDTSKVFDCRIKASVILRRVFSRNHVIIHLSTCLEPTSVVHCQDKLRDRIMATV